jgi:hypothetical protein
LDRSTNPNPGAQYLALKREKFKKFYVLMSWMLSLACRSLESSMEMKESVSVFDLLFSSVVDPDSDLDL